MATTQNPGGGSPRETPPPEDDGGEGGPREPGSGLTRRQLLPLAGGGLPAPNGLDVASTRPAPFSAWTSNWFAVELTGIAVSKPCRLAVATTDFPLAPDPTATTFHDFTCVAPFQLAYTVVWPPLAVAAPLGGYNGLPTHVWT